MGLLFSTATGERWTALPATLTARGRRPKRLRRRAVRRRRWDSAFAPKPLPEDLVCNILAHLIFSQVDPACFPSEVPLAGIIAHDARLRRLDAGDALYREGTYETSVYILLQGALRDGNPPILGVAEALTRRPRQATPVALSDRTVLLEIRWPGVRELRQWSAPFCALTDRAHYAHALYHGIRRCPALSGMSDEACRQLARHARLETHGSYEWSHRYRRATEQSGPGRIIDHEPRIAAAGDYLDEFLIVESGFVRVTGTNGAVRETIAQVGEGGLLGSPELSGARQSDRPAQTAAFPHDLHAIGYATLIRLPTYVIDDIILPSLPPSHHDAFLAAFDDASPTRSAGLREGIQHAADVDFAVDGRLFNGTEAMVIDLDRCVHCNECVRACAEAHDGVARFVRQGRTHANVMIAHACMHCRDAVCLIGCPTGAIHRQPETGLVLIDEEQCIGCTICASTCPYGNIQMAPTMSPAGRPVIDSDGNAALTAIKCDLCYSRTGGPACQRACSHDALQRIDLAAQAVSCEPGR